MTGEKPEKQNRVREALGRLYEEYPPYFREYLRRYEEDPTSRVFAPLAEAYRKLGRLDDAISICREGLEHHPEFHGGRVALAKCLMDKNDLGSARVELERVIRVAPENLLAQRLLGDVAKGLGDTVSALHAYKMALLLAPNDVALAEKVHELEHSTAVFLHSGGVSADGSVPVNVRTETPSNEDLAPLWSTTPTQSEPVSTTNTGSVWAAEDPGVMEPTLASLRSMDLEEVAEDNYEPSGSEVVDRLLGDSDSVDDEAFKIEHISAVFDEEAAGKKEITTETLGDLYFSQGQFERALRIFEKLPRTPELLRKLRDCKVRLGVDENRLQRSRQVALLRDVLKKAQNANARRAKS